MISLTISTGKGYDYVSELPARLINALNKDMGPALSKRLVGSVVETIKKDWLSQSPSSEYGLSTGALEKSWRGSFRRSGPELSIIASSSNRYAGVHATGRVIHGKPILVIPMENAEKFWGSAVYDMIEEGKVGLMHNPKAVVIRKATIKPKPIGSSKNYLELAADRFLAKSADIIQPMLVDALQGSGGGE